MKKVIKLSYLIIAILIVGCNSDDTEISDEALMEQVIENAKSGTWKITRYIDSGKDETNDYIGYIFTFNQDGSVVAAKGATAINGTWSVTKDDDSSDDNDSSDVDFNIFFSTPEIFQELTDDWDIVSNSASKISLIDISGGNGETDSLLFEKN